MVTPLIVSQVFARAWTLADDLQDVAAQNRLVELRRQSVALPLSGQDHVLSEVVALTGRLSQRREAGDSGPRS